MNPSMDRRELFANERIAHSMLQGHVTADQFEDGMWAQVIVPKAPLLDAPRGNRDREVLLGESMIVLEVQDGHAFVKLKRDGYVGYLEDRCIAAPPCNPTHYVNAARSYAKETPNFKAFEPVFDLSFGTLVSATGGHGNWTGIVFRSSQHPDSGVPYFVPTIHLAPIEARASDPVSIAMKFVGTPYLWGGNSAFGLDCSALVQAACLACGIPCPGDSDMQEARLGELLGDGVPLQRNDLLFWKGHVAMVVDAHTILHANAHHMAVAYEGLSEAIARIAAQGDGPVTACKRLSGF